MTERMLATVGVRNFGPGIVRTLVERLTGLLSLHSEEPTAGQGADASNKPALPRLFPDLDADQDHVHFEMTPPDGDSLLWLTLRRGIYPQRAAASLRKLADFIEREGTGLFDLVEGREAPMRLAYNQDGDIVVTDG